MTDSKPHPRQPHGRGGKRGGRHHRKPRNPNRIEHPSAAVDTSEASGTPENGMSDNGTATPLTSIPIPSDTPRFSELENSNLVHPLLIKAITEDLKFDHMMPVQAATLHELLPPHKKECLVQAKTGTGKTIAFLLPALQSMIAQGRGRGRGISLLVISPTRELAMQIAAEATSLLQRLPDYKVRIAIGGSNKDREERQILGGCDILVATPGRLLDHMENAEIIERFRHLDTLVLDEADRLLDMGFMKALKDIVGHLPDKEKVKRQGMLFSATIAPHVNQVAGLVLSPGYQFISTIPAGEANTHERVPQILVTVPNFASVAPALVGCVRSEAAQHQDFKAIVFAPTAALADFYGDILSQTPNLAPPVSVLHSRISQNKRTKITNDYRVATSAILVATDVVARGMDFPGCTTVIQAGIPADRQSYIHRLGRTARADADGRGVFIVSEAESWFPKWRLKEIKFSNQDADYSSAAETNAIAEGMEDSMKAKVYQAWLGYYINHLKGFGWDKEQLVEEGNTYSHDGLGSPEVPGIPKTTAGKMGLRRTKGIVLVPDPPRAGRGAQGGKRGGRGN